MAVLPPAVILSVRWQAKLASRKVCPGFRKVSLKIQISTSCWLRKCSSSSFLPRNPSAFQQARSSSLPHSFLLGRTAIFGHEKKNSLQDSQREGCPCGERGDGREEPTSQLHTCLEGGDRGDQKFSRVGRWKFVWGPPGRVLWVWQPRL